MSEDCGFDNELYGFGDDIEGVPEDLISQFDQPVRALKRSKPLMLGGLTINTDYPCHTSNYAKGRTSKIKWIVVHYTGCTGSALANVRYYGSTPLPKGSKASAHFFVGHAKENAQIYMSVRPEDVAWHAPGRNSDSVGIEVCCHNDTADKSAASLNWYFDKETVDALDELVRALMAEYGIDADHILRHYDVTGKICPALWVHDAAAWLAFKSRMEEEELKTGTITASMNGIETKLKTILYNDENYVRLRDLADAQKDDRLMVDWNEEQRKVIINSK